MIIVTIQVSLPTDQPQLLANSALLSPPASTTQLSAAGIEDDVLYKWLSLKKNIPKPFNLQLIGQREEGEDFVIRLSDGKRWHDFLLSTRFSYLFKKNFVKKNSIIQIIETKTKGGDILISNLKVTASESMFMIGDPTEI